LALEVKPDMVVVVVVGLLLPLLALPVAGWSIFCMLILCSLVGCFVGDTVVVVVVTTPPAADTAVLLALLNL